MADGLLVLERPAADGDGAGPLADQTGLSAVGTGLMAAQGGSLLRGSSFHGAGDQPPQCGHGDVFQSGQIDIRSGAVFAEGLAADDFSPASCQFLESIEIVWGECARGHLLSLLEVASNVGDELPLAMVGKPLTAAKPVLHPSPDTRTQLQLLSVRSGSTVMMMDFLQRFLELVP